LGRLHNILEQRVSASLFPKVEKVMLEELHVSHEGDVLFFNFDHLVADDLGVGFVGFVKAKAEDLNLEFNVIDGFHTSEFVFFNPFLELGNVFGMNEGFQ
jgi:hypothetical protein